MPPFRTGGPLIYVEITPIPVLPPDTTLNDRVIYALEQFRGHPLTDFAIAQIEQSISAIFMDAECRGEIPKAPRPLAVKIHVSGRVEVVNYPENATQAWATWDKLRKSLTRAEANDARDDLLRRLPEFYDQPRPQEIPAEPITREAFIEATGREPRHDDLERANCPQAGQIGHFGCGWNFVKNRPQWECA